MRFFAKGADLALGIAVCFMVRPFGTILGILYILLSDALIDGSSPMKWVVGLRCHSKRKDRSASFKESILRNLPFGLAAAMLLIPVLGVVLAVLVGGFFTAVESYFLYSDPDHMRLGDVLADTVVVREKGLRRPRDEHRELHLSEGDDPEEAEPGDESADDSEGDKVEQAG